MKVWRMYAALAICYLCTMVQVDLLKYDPICHLDDQEPGDRMRGLKLLCRFNLLKAEGVLIWKSPELLSACSIGDSVTLRGCEPSLLHGDEIKIIKGNFIPLSLYLD